MAQNKTKLAVLSNLILLVMLPCSLSISDLNSSNNNKTIFINITQTNEYPILYLNYRYEENDSLTSAEVFTDAIQQNDYLDQFFPITTENSFVILPQALIQSTELFENVSSNPSKDCDLLKDIDEKIAISGSFNSSQAGIVALASDAFFVKNNIGYSGFSCGHLKSVIVRATSDNKKASTHELGHGFDLCDEYNISLFNSQDNEKDCPNGDLDEGYNSSTKRWGDGQLDNRCIKTLNDGLNEGCLVDNDSLIKVLFSDEYNIPDSFDLVNLYGRESVFDYTESWINKETYNYLLSKLSGAQSYNCTSNPVIVIALNLFNETNGTRIQIDNFYVSLVGGCYDTQERFDEGSLNIQTKNSANAILSNLSIKPRFQLRTLTGDTINLNKSSLIVTLPFSNVSSFSFLVNGVENASRNVSAHMPNLTLISPNGGQRFENLFNISWNASDLDNDTLVYAVLISADNGTTWSTLIFDLNTTFYEVSNAWFNYGTNYKVKVLATDGVNTGSDFSDSNFTIVPPPSVKVDSIEEIFSNESRKVYEVVIENDGGQTLSNLSWKFNTGLANITNNYNVTLVSNEQLELLFDINYTSGGWMNVKIYSCKIKYPKPSQFYLIIVKSNRLILEQNKVANYAM